MNKTILLTVVVFWTQAGLANSVIDSYIDESELVGSGEYKAMFWKIYDAELHAKGGEFFPGDSFALKLVYSRKISGDAIADKSIELIRRQGVDDEVILAAWHRQLVNIFPDVEEGTEIIGVHEVGVGAHFYADGERVGSLKDFGLCRSFFGIWLAEDTIAPALRSDLLGLASN